MTRKPSEEILSELQAADDGLATRSIGSWTLQKLAILHLYLPKFADACRSARGGGCYVDGMAGPGIDRVKDAQPHPYFVWGSPLLALQTRPPIQRCVFMDLSKRNVKALEERTESFGGRTLVKRGDVNKDLVPLVRAEIPRGAPCFCFLDPEGPELKWGTVKGLARLPRQNRKIELMILFPLDMALLRLMPVTKSISEKDKDAVSEMFATQDWWDIYQARLSGEIEPAMARAGYLELYRKDLKALGYAHVISRPVVLRRGAGMRHQDVYHLFFASDHDAGERIMRHIFQRPLELDLPVSQQPTLFE